MFKVDEQVIIKEVHKKYGRSSSTIEMLEDIQKQGLVGKVITTDVSDSMLNTYVSFEGAETNIWLNNDELVKHNPFRLLTNTLEGFAKIDTVVNTELTTISNKQENNLYSFSDDMKIELFDYLVKEVMEGKNIKDKESLYNRLMFNYAIDLYTDMLIDDNEFDIKEKLSKDEIRSIVKYLLNEFSYDFNISVEDVIKKFK